MGGGETGGEIEFWQGGSDREGVLETFRDDEISAPGAGPEADGMAVQLSDRPLRIR